MRMLGPPSLLQIASARWQMPYYLRRPPRQSEVRAVMASGGISSKESSAEVSDLVMQARLLCVGQNFRTSRQDFWWYKRAFRLNVC